MIARAYCDRCGRRALVCRLQDVLVSRRTHWEPAEYAQWCERCVGPERDPDYERAAARYDGEGRDWR